MTARLFKIAMPPTRLDSSTSFGSPQFVRQSDKLGLGLRQRAEPWRCPPARLSRPCTIHASKGARAPPKASRPGEQTVLDVMSDNRTKWGSATENMRLGP